MTKFDEPGPSVPVADEPPAAAVRSVDVSPRQWLAWAALGGLLGALCLVVASESHDELDSLPPPSPPASAPIPTYSRDAWSTPIVAGRCSHNATPLRVEIAPIAGSVQGVITCRLENGATRVYNFPPGIFEIDIQLLLPESTSIVGASSPNDMAAPTRSPAWHEQTLFLATRGVSSFADAYCYAPDMVHTRVGFVLSSNCAVRNISYQGLDTIRPNDNGALCGGAAFETKGCALNDCSSPVNNGGSDGVGSKHVVIENVRLNDYYYGEDRCRIGAAVAGNSDCKRGRESGRGCCYCQPNGVRTTQVGVWVPQTRDAAGTRDVVIRDVVLRSSQADGINLHGAVRDVVAERMHFESTGDDVYALWGAALNPQNVTFRDAVAVNPGVLRPKWYGNCVATYGLRSVLFANMTCRAPTLRHPVPQPGDGSVRIDNSMFVFYSSFGASYPLDNNVTIRGWTFESLDGIAYTPATGSMETYDIGKMVWSRSGETVAPFYLPTRAQQVNVYASSS